MQRSGRDLKKKTKYTATNQKIMFNASKTKDYFLKGIALVAGVDEKKLQKLTTKSPHLQREEARKLFGLSSAEIRMAKQIRRMTPYKWSLRNLRISEEDYKRLMDRKSSLDEGDDFEDVKEERVVESLKADGFRPSNFLVFQTYLWRTYAGPFKNKKGWRYVPPMSHLLQIQAIVDKSIEDQTIRIMDVFKVSLFYYYAVYNAIMGTKTSKQQSQAA